MLQNICTETWILKDFLSFIKKFQISPIPYITVALQNAMLLLSASETLHWSAKALPHFCMHISTLQEHHHKCWAAKQPVMKFWGILHELAWNKTQSAWNSFQCRGLPKENPELKIVWTSGIKDCFTIHMH